jgi:guanosine-3',5'-bis(diphosphate) 3'-pyrophosphohydrolase
MASKGAAAHWQYKNEEFSPSGSAQVRAREWLMRLVDVQRHTGDSLEFLDNAKSDLFPDEIFVFTPKGKPTSATTPRMPWSIISKFRCQPGWPMDRP